MAEVGEWLYGRGGRVAVQLRWALQWFGEGHERFTLGQEVFIRDGGGWGMGGARPSGSRDIAKKLEKQADFE